eukprot:m.1373275 g.1373275  ORF g.1373275 m.1373275 type:complete len:133 (-) comp24955_c1_seq139:1935-2333(-)
MKKGDTCDAVHSIGHENINRKKKQKKETHNKHYWHSQWTTGSGWPHCSTQTKFITTRSQEHVSSEYGRQHHRQIQSYKPVTSPVLVTVTEYAALAVLAAAVDSVCAVKSVLFLIVKVVYAMPYPKGKTGVPV